MRLSIFSFFALFLLAGNVHAQQGTGTPAPSGTNVATATGTAPGSLTGTATGTGPVSTPTTSLPPRTPMDPLGSLILNKPLPNPKDPPLFALGVDLQFSWTYDKYLLLPPTNLTIEAYVDKLIIPIAEGLPGNLLNYTWTAQSQKNASNPIITSMYTLRIFDGAVGRYGRLPEGGYLSPYNGLRFGLYIPEAYLPGNQVHPNVCATCEFAKITNGATNSNLPQGALVGSTLFLLLLSLLMQSQWL